jgi:hypothetical protein
MEIIICNHMSRDHFKRFTECPKTDYVLFQTKKFDVKEIGDKLKFIGLNGYKCEAFPAFLERCKRHMLHYLPSKKYDSCYVDLTAHFEITFTDNEGVKNEPNSEKNASISEKNASNSKNSDFIIRMTVSFDMRASLRYWEYILNQAFVDVIIKCSCRFRNDSYFQPKTRIEETSIIIESAKLLEKGGMREKAAICFRSSEQYVSEMNMLLQRKGECFKITELDKVLHMCKNAILSYLISKKLQAWVIHLKINISLRFTRIDDKRKVKVFADGCIETATEQKFDMRDGFPLWKHFLEENFNTVRNELEAQFTDDGYVLYYNPYSSFEFKEIRSAF